MFVESIFQGCMPSPASKKRLSLAHEQIFAAKLSKNLITRIIFQSFFFLFAQNSVDLTLEGTMNLEGRGKR